PAPPAADATPFNGVSIGASHLKNTPKPLDTLAIVPPSISNPVSNGPSATAKAPTFKINCCWPSLKSLYQLTTSFALSTILVKVSPILSPISAAFCCTSSDDNNSMNSEIDSFDCSNTPQSRV